MRLLLNTTYFLPAIDISVKNLPKDTPLRLLRKAHKILMNYISILGLSARGARHIVAKRLSAERVGKGIRAIIYNETMTIVQTHESTMLLIAFKLRSMLSDLIDYLILSSALNQFDSLIAEVSDILNYSGLKP
ncbi:MAG: hypothetical protein ACUVTL_10620 [Thermoproteota archaeon]